MTSTFNLKRPESVLVVVYDPTSFNVLMLQRQDDRTFWQSVTGSLEFGETPHQAAVREVQEELGLDARTVDKALMNCNKSVVFEIFPQFRHRYAPGITHCREHWFLMALSAQQPITLSEHSAYQWLTAQRAVECTKSWNNAQAIEEFILKRNNKEDL
ncbi:dihydroneopterin triphosphate diphosphatase [Spirabiliibacterium falconis]|uniref:dihydroneopterin triphosphate diphosphatase n=1 Tax=Spirabiliibacterium falconis TaxID=572023 RepID=UPI001AAC6066|nr:dihydroneopterin triphosphate diphosphatase [Spirabiliibacterium falconis]MBE2893875.1 dihydroneopterin triphosphate diphosphatase [Spirabiliibacterium falconis]